MNFQPMQWPIAWVDMASVQKSAEPVATLFDTCSGLEDLDELLGTVPITSAMRSCPWRSP